MSSLKAEIYFILCKVAGFSLLFALWIREGGQAGFFLLLFLVVMSLLRWRMPKLSATVLLDCVACILVSATWGYAPYALILLLFEGMYRNVYWVLLFGPFLPAMTGNVILQPFGASGFANEWNLVLLAALSGLCGLFLKQWEREQAQKLVQRDTEAEKYYELEHRQSDIMTVLPQIERMTAVAERARIARDIHDNAGHEIVAAYISFQTVRGLFEGADADALELYDAAMERLNNGVNKIRETAHNLQTVAPIGVENLLEICERFPVCPVRFSTFGDTARIPMYVWSMLESCLNESLTNAARHANPSYVLVELDATEQLVRLLIENDGGFKRSAGPMGTGMRNLRRRAMAIGGTFSIDPGARFRVVCVIPIREEENESIDS